MDSVTVLTFCLVSADSAGSNIGTAGKYYSNMYAHFLQHYTQFIPYDYKW